jgi:hypothetical protein
MFDSPWEDYKEQVFRLIKFLCWIDTDTVRVHAVTCIHHLASNLSKKANQSNALKADVDAVLLPLLKQLIVDKSWKVRYSVCQNLENVRRAYPDSKGVP